MNNSLKRPGDSSKKNRLIDIALGIVIILSIGFIAQKIFTSKTKPRAVTTEAGKPTTTNLRPATRPTGRGAGWFSWLSTFRPISDSAWQVLISDPTVAPFSVKNTKSCDDQNAPKLWSLFIDDPNAVAKLQSDEFRIAFDPADRLCVRLKDTVNVIATQTDSARSYLEFLGQVEIESVLNLEAQSWPAKILGALGLTQEDVDQNLKIPRGAKKSASPLFRWSKMQPGKSDALPPRPTTLSPMTRARFVSTAPAKYLIVDLRLPEVAEKEKATLKKNDRLEMISVPFRLPPGVSPTFSYSVTVAQIERAVFEVEKILLTDKSHFAGVVLVGSGPTDGRPLWAERGLRKVGIKLFDFPEGAQHLDTLTQ